VHFLYFLFDRCIGRLLKSGDFKGHFFQRKSIALQRTFLNFWSKVHFLLVFRTKCREMSGHCHGFILTKKCKKCIFGLCTLCFTARFFFFKKGTAQRWCVLIHAKTQKSKSTKKPTGHVTLLLGKRYIVKYTCAFGKT